MSSFLAKKAETADFPDENSCGPRNLSQKSRKGQILKKLASKSKKLELNCTNLKLNSKKTRSDCTKAVEGDVDIVAGITKLWEQVTGNTKLQW
jgi:hypothetical protein